ncbi:MFS transporter [Arthrobacter sp. ok362]|uniref:MFS transporter n=1 Tax=Arthrobacter sp. ok362 TaxID=1761745 RepID=UPI000885AFD4|nr:MFS transporter [Arthrobacter sp. ok362]SDL16205.1 Sugar transporter [Arthrobacter sp. ok362]
MDDSTTSTSIPPNALAIDPDLYVSTPRQQRRVLLSSLVGALIEWYDFYLFGIASAMVFNVLFFPQFDPLVGTLLAFITLAVGFFARPLGGAIWGHYGDKVGRKQMLVLSILAMGVCTTAMGLLPTYAQIGVAAPVLLLVLRLVQGIAAGGEWGGAVLMAMEHSPKRRGFSSSFPQMGLTGGILVANGVFALVAGMMPEDQLLAWGWRIPFLLSAVLVMIGLWIRLGVSESPVFLAEQRKQAQAPSQRKAPLVEVFRHPRTLIVTILLVIGPFAVSAVYLTFAASYGLQVGFSRSDLLTASIVAAAVGVIGQPIFATWSDYIGRKKVVGLGLILQAVTGVIFFAQMNAGSVAGLYWSISLIAIAHAICYAPLAAWLGELFPTHLRYTGSSMGYQIAGTLGGGLTPAVCTWLLITAGGAPHSELVVIFAAAASLLSLVGVLMAKETYKAKL